MPGIVVLASGNGTNLQVIIDAIQTGVLICEIRLVIVDRACFAYTRAKRAGIAVVVLDRKIHRQNLSTMILKEIGNVSCDLVVLAGFLSILDVKFIETSPVKIINLHPALLPKFGGAGMWGIKVHQAVLAAGETESGCTIHYVNGEIDSGEIIAQSKLTVNDNDTPETLQERVSLLEHKLMVDVIAKLTASNGLQSKI